MIYLCFVTSIGTAYSCGKHIAAWREPKLHICGIVMASTLQHGVNRRIVKTYEFPLPVATGGAPTATGPELKM